MTTNGKMNGNHVTQLTTTPFHSVYEQIPKFLQFPFQQTQECQFFK